MDEHSREEWASLSHEHAKECLSKIIGGDTEACFELAQIFMSRITQKDIPLILIVIEALTQQAAASGSTAAREFLDDGWVEMQRTLERRLKKVFGE